MKRILTTVLITSTMLFACIQNNNDFIYDEATGARFVKAASATSESTPEPVAIVVVITSSSGSATGSVNFTINPGNGNPVEGTDYTILNTSTTLDFSEGISDTIYIQPLDNSDASGAKTLEIQLLAGTIAAGLPGENANLSSHQLTINDDDCALDINDFVQNYSVCEIGYGGFEASVSLDESQANALLVTNLGDWGGTDAVLVFDPDVSTSIITIAQLPNGYGFDCDGDGITDPLFWSGSGQYIACTQEFQVEYFFICADGTVLATGIDIFTLGENPGCNPLF